MAKYFYLEVNHLADRRFNKAIEVYKLTRGFPKMIGANYRMSSATWYGASPEARQIIRNKCGHQCKSIYHESWKNKTVSMVQLGDKF